MTDKYILEGHIPVTVPDLLAWARWFETAERHVAEDHVGPVRISTVFLGMDHNWGSGPPVLFETMVFGGPLDEAQERYTTWDEAMKGHAAMLARIKEKS